MLHRRIKGYNIFYMVSYLSHAKSDLLKLLCFFISCWSSCCEKARIEQKEEKYVYMEDKSIKTRIYENYNKNFSSWSYSLCYCK